MIEVREEEERVVLIGVALDDKGAETEASLNELSELASTAGAVTAAIVVQNRDSVHPGTYIGKGKITEVAEIIEREGASGIICDDELSPAQMKNLEEELQVKVMDRTMLILDIFAKHAMTREGKIQVELAQLKYRSGRLIGMRNSMSRVSYGIGMRGPGEKKLEMDRRLIKDRISQLNSELEEVKKNRETARGQRLKSAMPVVAIVGYTNAGKSTLLNLLTDAGVLEKDMLFATLDPTTRKLKLESGQEILLTDTVGFIRKLPHHLIDAFRSTLEEARYADIILHVVDSSNTEADRQMEIVYETLRKLEVKDKVVITAFNKQDVIEGDNTLKDLQADKTINISARTGQGIKELLDIIERVLRDSKVYIEKTFPYSEAGRLSQVRKYGQLLEEEYTEEGIFIRAYVPKNVYQMIDR